MGPEISLHQLRLVTRVAELASFTRAAGELRLSQPALSRTVREVERTLRVRLFDRTTRSVRLTPRAGSSSPSPGTFSRPMTPAWAASAATAPGWPAT